jgi:hypothetical protein
MTGGYYWFPVPDVLSPAWTVLTCHELGCDADAGHLELWPLVIDRLAWAWRRDGRLLRRHLRNHYTGLPRGRVTRPERDYLGLSRANISRKARSGSGRWIRRKRQ